MSARGLLVLVLACLLGCGRPSRESAPAERPVPVQVARAAMRELPLALQLTGDVRPFKRVEVHPKVAGKVLERLLVEKGDRVKKGQLLGVLEHEDALARLRRVRASLEAARAELRRVEAELERIEKDKRRIEELYRQRVVAKQRLDHILSQYRATVAARDLARARIRELEAAVREARVHLEDHFIRAPIAGVVTQRYVDEGFITDYMLKQPIVAIAQLDPLKVVVNVVERDLPRVRVGQVAEIRVDAYPKRRFEGRVALIRPELDPTTRTAEVEVHVPNREGLLRPGMFAHVRIRLGRRRTLTVPYDALVRFPGSGVYYAFVVNGGRAERRRLRVGLIEGRWAEVLEGVREGELVVTRGQGALRGGERVEVVR